MRGWVAQKPLARLYRSQHPASLPPLLKSWGLASESRRCYGVIIKQDGDNMIRTQISVDEILYRRAKRVAERKGISLAELCRRSLEAVVAQEPSEKPWMAFAGIVEGSVDDSTSVDDVVYGREAP